MRPKKRSLPARAGLCLLACLLGATTLVAGGTKGKVKKHVYYSPENNFNVPVPSGLGTKVDDGYDKSGVGAVSFHDDFGGQQGIHYMRIPPDVLPKFDETALPADMLSHWLNNVAMVTWFRPVSADSRVLHETAAPFENMEVLLAEVEIPSGSSMVVTDKSGTRRADSTRGLVIFRRGKYVYMLTTEEASVFANFMASKSEKKEVPAGDWTKFAEGMKSFYHTISFTD
jgi:hypothetical protein